MFFGNSKKICKNYQMLWMKGEMVHIYGKMGNNERENIGKAVFMWMTEENGWQFYRKRG